MRLSAVMPNFTVVPHSTNRATQEAAAYIGQFRRDLRLAPLEKLPKELTGKFLWFFHDVCGIPLADCWSMIRPDSGSTGPNATKQASRYLNHYKRNNPAGISDALMASGITIQDVTDMAKQMFYATKWAWNPKTERREPTKEPDWTARNRAIGRILEMAKLDTKVRDELVLGAAENRKMQLNTGPKFETIQEWQEWMESQHEITMKERAEAARDMRLIAAGRQIIQEKGQKTADKYRQAALDAGMTGDEPLPGIDDEG